MIKIRIGIMGCASIADRSVIPAIKFLTNRFELKAVSSREYEKAYKFAQKFDCEAIVGYDELINRNDIDAIYIPLPTGLHKKWITKALNAGKHVYAEKSLAIDYSDAVNMTNLAKKNNLALMEGYMFQYHSQYEKVHKYLRDGKIGEIRSLSASFGFPPLPSNNFRYDKTIGGGALMDCAGYVVRIAYFILGSNIKIKAASMHFINDSSIYGNAFMTGEKGVGAHLSFGFDNYYQCNCKIWGSKGIISLNKAFTPQPDEAPLMILETKGSREDILLEPDNHFIGALNEFYLTINGDQVLKNKHYQAILEQSETLDLIEQFSRCNF